MARARGGSMAAYGLAAVLAIVVVFLLILAIMFNTQLREAQLAASDWEAKLERTIKSAELNHDVVANISQKVSDPDSVYHNQSIVGSLLIDLQRLKQRITGSENAVLSGIETELSKLGVSREISLIGEIRRLSSEKEADERLIAQLQRDAKDAIAMAQEAEKQKQNIAQDFEQAVQSLRSDLQEAQRDYSAYKEQAQAKFASLEEQHQQTLEQKNNQISEIRSQIAQKDQQILELRNELNAGPRNVAGRSQVQKPLDPDGHVVTILSQENQVYINRGSADHIILGMTFEIFPAGELVKLNEYDELRGKGTIEIMSVTDRSAVGRIVRSEPNRTINEGDQIVNLVYDPNATYRFFVHGLFDIDRSGELSIGDRRRIEAMVQNWGGNVARELDYEVDYVVLGKEPEMPDRLDPDEINPVVIQRHAEQERRYNEYQEMIGRARELGIPILNQNRFLGLVGYYQR